MADYQAVALGIKPADPGQAFDSINSILGMQQKRQGLQIQAQQLQQEQLKTEGQQGAAQYFQDFDPTQWVTANGTTDVNGIMAGDSKFKGLNGVAKPLVMDQLQKMQGHQLENMRTLGQMDSETVSDFAQRANTWAQNPEVKKDSPEGRAYVQSEIQKYGLLDPQKAKIAQIYGKAFGAPGQGGAKQDHLAPALAAMGAQAQTVSEQQAQSNPQQTTNAAGQILNREKTTGALSAPPGAAPGTALNPSTPMVAGATALATGAAGGDVDRANEVGGLQQQSAAAIQLTKQADKLKEELDSGHLAKMISNTGNYLGFSSVNDARAQLNQDLGKMKGLVASRAGSDSRAAAMLEGYPQDTTPNNTFHADMDYLRGTARQNLARGKLLDDQYSKDRRGFQAADNLMTRTTNPLMHEFNALKPEERGAFYKHNFTNPQDAQAFKHEVEALKKHSHVLD